MSEKEIKKKCPKCNQALNKIKSTNEKRTHIGYFCNNCGTSFKIEEVD